MPQTDNPAKASILLVDDTPANLHLLIEALGEEAYEVRPAINGELALESARSQCPDLVLLDINLPGIDGYQVCQQLKADPRTREVPVIFISSMEETFNKLAAFDAGGVDYISKPFEPAEVLARIGSHLELRRVQLELVEHKANLELLVAERTQELEGKNRALQAEVEYRKEIERALQESEHRYLALVESSFDGIFIHQDHQIIYLNEQLAEIFRCRPHDLLGGSDLDLVVPESRDKVRQYAAAAETGILEIDMVRPDGSIFSTESFGVACKFQGDPARIVAVRDVSKRKQAEAELQASEQRYANLFHQFETLLDAISDPLVLLSAEMEPIWTNAAYDQICDELGCGLGSGLTLFHVGVSERDSPVQRCLDSGAVIEDLMTTPDRRIWGVKAFPMKHGGGQTGQVIAIAVNVTEKVRLREEANRASRLASLGELAAGIAHEINNPNAVVLLNTPIIKDALADAEPILDDFSREQGGLALAGIDYVEMRSELPSLIDRVQESAERIKRIVEDLKSFVRDEGPKELSEVDPNLVVEASVRLLENSIKKATGNFTVELAENLPTIKGDFQKLEQVVVNLLQNACQSLTARDQEIRVVTAFDSQRRKVVLKVIDQGCGIDSEQLSRISDPFFTTKREVGGTGLGLSVSERILQECQGQLSIESSLGQGSEFSVLLPMWDKES